jgi:hypothetical protein
MTGWRRCRCGVFVDGAHHGCVLGDGADEEPFSGDGFDEAEEPLGGYGSRQRFRQAGQPFSGDGFDETGDPLGGYRSRQADGFHQCPSCGRLH